MTLNILFMTVTIKKRMVSPEEHMQQEMIRKVEEENRMRIANLPRIY
ncbi:YrzI family small protein [Bacillus sp. CGMCC 1.16607]